MKEEDLKTPENVDIPRVAKIAAALGIAAILVIQLPGVNYNIIADEHVQGRELNTDLTSKQLDDIKTGMKSALLARQILNLNQVFAIEDVINYSCPGIKTIRNISGGITTQQLINFIDGNCSQ